jgi:hypothetical protein
MAQAKLGWQDPYTAREKQIATVVKRVYEAVSLPYAVAALLFNKRIHASYRMTWPRKFLLGWRMYRNTKRIPSATSYKAHLAMAAKLLETPPEVEGIVVECGCYQGGSTTNLSLICDIVGRELVVYDSFEGMPPPKPDDKYALPEHEGSFMGTLDQVRGHVERYGAVGRCSFRKGWFSDTLPHHTEPIVLCFLDVDHQASLHDCLVNLWPHLERNAYVFIDEYTRIDYCAVFFSERYWRTYFDTTPPGLLGVGIGVAIGQYFLGPYLAHPPLQTASSVAYTRKSFVGHWDYFPDPTPVPADDRTTSGSAR